MVHVLSLKFKSIILSFMNFNCHLVKGNWEAALLPSLVKVSLHILGDETIKPEEAG
jgi:hypothetical protein